MSKQWTDPQKTFVGDFKTLSAFISLFCEYYFLIFSGNRAQYLLLADGLVCRLSTRNKLNDNFVFIISRSYFHPFYSNLIIRTFFCLINESIRSFCKVCNTKVENEEMLIWELLPVSRLNFTILVWKIFVCRKLFVILIWR